MTKISGKSTRILEKPKTFPENQTNSLKTTKQFTETKRSFTKKPLHSPPKKEQKRVSRAINFNQESFISTIVFFI
jgi:hypothetical protein